VKTAFVSAGLVAAMAVFAADVAHAANKIAKGPGTLSVNCADFQKLPDGSWKSGPAATLSYPSNPASFADTTFPAKDGIQVDGVDIGEFLEKNCTAVR
jgi:hypothetical protein